MITKVQTICGEPVLVHPEGDPEARIMVIGEYPTADDIRLKGMFLGSAGTELRTLLSTAGIIPSECFFTYVARKRTPYNDWQKFFASFPKRQPTHYLSTCRDQVLLEISEVKPDLIILVGELPLWAVLGEKSITKWRGSQIEWVGEMHSCKVLPVLNAGTILRQWTWRGPTVGDLKRAANYKNWEQPNYDFTIRPNLSETIAFLDQILHRAEAGQVVLGGDLETRAGHIACFGIGTSSTRALCIPFMDINQDDSAYWTEAEEVAIVKKLVQLFWSPRIFWIFQNGAFDYQYFVRHWGAIPQLATDTMLEHHVAWAGDLPKGLDFLSSMYCRHHLYWKEDGKFWDPRYTPEEQLWEYNCKDSVKTFEIAGVLAEQTKHFGLEEQVTFQCQRQFLAVLAMMIRGVKCDKGQKSRLSDELAVAKERLERRLTIIAGYPLNVRSPKQMQHFFYEELGLPVQRNRKNKNRPTCDSKALARLVKKAPWVTPIVDIIETIRSVGVFKSTFIDMELDTDGRIRCSYNIAGTETFRYSSSENAFRSGGNLQNIPKGDGKLLPNVKNVFIPDEGYLIAEHDLAQADAQIVAWEAGDDKLKYIFRNGIDLHLANASDIYRLNIPLDELAEPDGIEFYKKKYPRQRQASKAGVHATNYGARARTLAVALGISVAEAQRFIDLWFGEHPAIDLWQRDINIQVQSTRTVYNKFGFRRCYLDRVEDLLPEALAWIPQSTVALVIDNGLVNIHENIKEVQPLMQVHDSLLVQYPIDEFDRLAPLVSEAMHITIPYDDPLIIPVGIEVSKVRWGAKREISWTTKSEAVTW